MAKRWELKRRFTRRLHSADIVFVQAMFGPVAFHSVIDRGSALVFWEGVWGCLGDDPFKRAEAGAEFGGDSRPRASGSTKPRIEPAQWVEGMNGTDEAMKAAGPAEPARGRCMEMDATYGVGFPGGIRLDIPRRFVGNEVAELLGLESIWRMSCRSGSLRAPDRKWGVGSPI